MVARDPIFTRRPSVSLVDYNERQCPEHGGYPHHEVEQFQGGPKVKTCSRCRWQALNVADVPEDRRAAAQQEAQEILVNELLIGSGITERFRGATFDTFLTKDQAQASALLTCSDYAVTFPAKYQAGQCLLMLGNIGTGKTHLASSIVQQVIRDHRAQAVIVPASGIFRAVKSTMSRAPKFTEEDVLEELGGFDLLVIDEVGASRGSDWEVQLLHEVIDRRYQAVRPTIVVSNLITSDLKDYIGERAMDRLRQGGGDLIGFTWASVRRATP